MNAQIAPSATALTLGPQRHIGWGRTDVSSGATMVIQGKSDTIFTKAPLPMLRRLFEGGAFVYTVLPTIVVETSEHGIAGLAQAVCFIDPPQAVSETPLIEHVRRPRHLLLPPPGPPLMLPPRRPNIAPLLSSEEDE